MVMCHLSIGEHPLEKTPHERRPCGRLRRRSTVCALCHGAGLPLLHKPLAVDAQKVNDIFT